MILLDVAKAEGEAAADWYERRRAGLGDDFLAELRLALQFVEKSPRLCAPLEPARPPHELRQWMLNKFTYVVLFEVLPDGELIVLAISHTSRRPGYWLDRLY